jgi:hypothetical protein
MRGFVLGVFLLALVGWCMVHETMKQTQARYALAEAAQKESELAKGLEKLRVKEESLKQPSRLATLAKELKLDVINLAVMPADDSSASVRTAAKTDTRRPGDFHDAGFAERGNRDGSTLAQADGR